MVAGPHALFVAVGLLPVVQGLSAGSETAKDFRPADLRSVSVPWDEVPQARRSFRLGQQLGRCAEDSLLCRLESIAPRPRPSSSQELIKAFVLQSITVEELSTLLSMDETQLAHLNGVDENHRFEVGDWLLLPKAILEYRSVSKLKSTYTDKLPKMVNPATGRVHTNYGQAIAVTGRLSSNEPNLQNIPVRTVEGRRIREA